MEMASKVAMTKLPRVAVQPLDDVEWSSVPRSSNSFLDTGTEMIPAPLGMEGWGPGGGHQPRAIGPN